MPSHYVVAHMHVRVHSLKIGQASYVRGSINVAVITVVDTKDFLWFCSQILHYICPRIKILADRHWFCCQDKLQCRIAMTSSTWQDVVHQVQSHRDQTLTLIQPPIPKLPTELPCNVTTLPQTLLSPREAEITTTNAEDLVASLAAGRLTSTEVTNAFLRRAGLAQKLVSTVSVVFVIIP